jgi:hypothetical protein
MDATDLGELARKDFIGRHRRPPDLDDSNSDRAEILAFAHTSFVLAGEESLVPEMESNILHGAREQECSVY